MADRIVLDYGGCPVVTETATVLDYIGAMVERVREKAEQMGLPLLFVFKMPRRLWEAICDLYICIAPDESVPNATLEQARVKLRAEQALFVGGIRYPVELDETVGDSIWLVPEDDAFRERGSPAVLQNVGVDE